MSSWVFWHQLYCWYAKSEYTLGLALALAEAMGLKEHQPTQEYLIDMLVHVQTVGSCLTAAELDHDISVGGYAVPNYSHVSAGSIVQLKARQRLTEILRILPGSSLVVAPADTDLADPEMKDGLEESFGGGSFTALQRAALLNLAWDHISSGLDGRESAFELHANGGIPLHRRTIRSRFKRYSQLANGVLEALSVDMPAWTWRSCARCGWPSRAWRFRCPPAPKSGVSGVDAELLPRVSTDGRDGGRHQL